MADYTDMGRITFNRHDAAFVDTPRGIFTAAGVWFHTTEKALRQYAEPVLEHASLPELLKGAEVWLRSSQTLVLWLLPLLLLLIPPLPAALGGLVLYVGWKALSPGLVNRLLVRLFQVLENVLLQGLYYVVVLSLLAAGAQYGAVAVGLSGFILLRWGLLARVTQPLVAPLWASLYELPVPDQVLRGLIIRTALKHRLSLPGLDRMEQEMYRRLRRR